ncbi:MAG: hypothetical protein GY861_25100 [bacterium]|nr:hypothetical protein [bacterium]
MEVRLKCNNAIVDFNMNTIMDMVNKRQKIGLIKKYREISNKGLKDSKDAIESCVDGLGHYDPEKLRSIFSKHMTGYPEPYTKDEFMNLIENAIDNMDVYRFPSMLHAVDSLLDNIKNEGGLKKIAMERDDYLEAI